MSGSSLAPRPPKHLGLWATLAAILGGGFAYAAGCDGPTYVVSAGFAAVIVRIALIDLKLRIIQNSDVFCLLITGLIWTSLICLDCGSHIINDILRIGGYAFVFQIFRMVYARVRGRNGLGAGDVKLAAAVGPFVEIDQFGWILFLSAAGGMIFMLFLGCYRSRPISKYTYIPFGAIFSAVCYSVWLLSAIIGNDY